MPDRKKLTEAVGFVPPPSDIVRVNDPDGRVRWWTIGSPKDDQIIQDIEVEGSVQVYVDHPELQSTFHQYHFRLPLAEVVHREAAGCEEGHCGYTVFRTALAKLISVIVVGFSHDEYDGYRCFSELKFTPSSGYSYERWFGSLEDLAQHSDTDCFLFAKGHGEMTAEYRQMFSNLYPTLQVQYRENGCTFRVADLKAILAEESPTLSNKSAPPTRLYNTHPPTTM
jgi:hypothetical protein